GEASPTVGSSAAGGSHGRSRSATAVVTSGSTCPGSVNATASSRSRRLRRPPRRPRRRRRRSASSRLSPARSWPSAPPSPLVRPGRLARFRGLDGARLDGGLASPVGREGRRLALLAVALLAVAVLAAAAASAPPPVARLRRRLILVSRRGFGNVLGRDLLL